MISLSELKAALGGYVSSGQLVCPGPGHSAKDRSLKVRPSPTDPLGFVVDSEAGDDWRECKDYVADRLGIERDGRRSTYTQRPDPIARMLARAKAEKAEAADRERRKMRALAIWAEAVIPQGTMVETYLASRALALPVEIAGAVLRFHSSCPWRDEDGELRRVPAMVGLMRSITTGEPMAVHRTRLSAEGIKIGRKMLGPSAGTAIMLDRSTNELVAGEGVETGLAARQLGLSPVWALGSVGGIERLPVLPGVERLTLLEERDESGASLRAVTACGARWQATNKHVTVIRPRVGSDLNDALRSMSR